MLKSRLRLWASKNKNSLPENLLIYCDGVSKGQYKIVLNQELPLLRKACKEIYPPNNSNRGLPRISFIIVGKRYNTRFYPTNESDAN
jgi:eukaryotic translation initiation factor 2C